MKLTRDTLSDDELVDPRRWQPYVLDDSASSIDEWPGPWSRRVDDLPVDAARTRMLTAFDVPLSVKGGDRPGQGTSSGKPWNVVTGAERTQKVWDLARPIGGTLFAPKLPVERIALPDVVRRQGDPLGSSDLGLIVLRPGVELVEAIAFERRNAFQMWSLAPLAALNRIGLTVGYSGIKTGVYRYDLRKPWSKSMGGTSAAGLPKLPMLVRADELERGQIRHTLFFSLPNYSPDKPVGMASGTDGEWPGHPVRAGDILRLPAATLDRYRPGTAEHTVAAAMHEHGVMCGDKSSYGDPTVGKMSVSCALDSRIGTVDLGLSMSDFEVVAQ